MGEPADRLPVGGAVPTPGVRRFNLGDWMILTAAVALSLASAVAPVSHIAESFRMIPPAGRSIAYLDDLAWRWDDIVRRLGPRSWVASGVIDLILGILLPLAPALVIVRLRRPRPALRRLGCQPGFAACISVCLALIIAADLAFARLALVPPPVLMIMPGIAAAAAWLTLVVSGRWYPEAGWIDRAGRFVGGLWIAVTPLAIWMAA